VTTLSNGTATITPDAVDGYDAEQEARTISHEIIGRTDDDVTFRPAGPRSGALRLVFGSEADADEARALHAAPAVWTLTNPGRPTLGMLYVVANGSIGITLDATRAAWVVTVPFREVAP
jgi:hypothetical protein